MAGEKMIIPICVNSILGNLHFLSKSRSLTDGMRNQIQSLLYELEPLNIYLMWLAKWNDASEKKNLNRRNKLLGFFPRRNKNHFGFGQEPLVEATLERAKEKLSGTSFSALHRGEFEDWNTLVSDLLEISQFCKPKIEEDCLHFLDSSFKGVFSKDELKIFMENILRCLRNLLTFKANVILDVKVKIESIDLFEEVFGFTLWHCKSLEVLEDFKIHTQSWAWNAAWRSILCWSLNETEEKMASTLNAILCDINPSTPEATRMYLAVLKASKPYAGDSFLFFRSQEQTKRMVLKFVQFLLENLRVDLENDCIQMLHSGLLFSVTFLMYPPEETKKTEEGQLILAQANAVIDEAAFLISSLSADQFNEDIAEERDCLLLDFVRKFNAIKEEVRKLYAHSLLRASSDFTFPMVNVLEFIESIIDCCNEISKPFPKHDFMTLQKDMLSFLHVLKLSNLKKLQNNDMEIKDLWTPIVNVAYQAERALSSFIYMSNTIWHDMLCLSDVMEQMKLIKGEIKMIEDQHIPSTDTFNNESYSCPIIPLQARIPRMDEVVVGIDDKVEDILDLLLRGSTDRDIILIVGMPGIGKTTLAKKVYNHPSIRYHFNKSTWCTISQAYSRKRLLLDILSGLGEPSREFSKLDEEDLAETLYKSLKGQKYLIIMDDIWDVRAWDSLKMLFPNDTNGSRILLTSRICNVVLEAKLDRSPYPLGPLTEEDSWELLEKKIFYGDSCPPNFVEIGKQIATNCKGLPLAIVLVAGLLKEKIEDLNWWKEIQESLGLLIAKEGFADLLELSYKHLPDFLKPCFLYFGSFQEDQDISVQKLIQLWVSEGLIPKHDKKSLEVVAMEYLMDLIARSLINISKRSYTGEIKTCRIHDLLREFCLVKGQQEKLLKVVNPNTDVTVFSWVAIFNHYWVWFQGPCDISSLCWIRSDHFVHSLLSFDTSYIDCTTINKPFLFRFKFLRVLALENFFIGKFPEDVTALVLLRYLGIWCAGSIPEVIGRLKNLETLHFPGRISCLPLAVWGLEKLRHVDAGDFSISTDFSSNVPALENIQTFSSPSFGNIDQAEMVLRRISKVQKLKCYCREVPNFDFLSLLESLNVTGVGFRYRNFYFPSTLKKLVLKKFELTWIDISAIGKLPNLEVLKLIGNSIKGNSRIGNGLNKTWDVKDGEFLTLRFLKLQLFDIQQWNVCDDAFPCLERLMLEFGDRLEEIPSAFGRIPSLNMIRVRRCNSTVERSAMLIQEEQLEWGNEDLQLVID